MKKILLLIVVLMALISQVFASPKAITITRVPVSVEEFVFLRNSLALTPEGGAAIFITSMLIYTKDRNVGMECMTIALDQTRLSAGNTYKGFTPDREASAQISRLSEKNKSYIPYSYINKTHPDRFYSAVLPFVFNFEHDPNILPTQNEAKIMIRSSGDQILRAVYLQRNDRGVWKVTKFDDLMRDVKQPVVKKTDDL